MPPWPSFLSIVFWQPGRARVLPDKASWRRRGLEVLPAAHGKGRALSVRDGGLLQVLPHIQGGHNRFKAFFLIRDIATYRLNQRRGQII